MSAPDKNVERNRQLLLDRSLVGLQKYGVTTERGDLTHKQWMQHLLEELLDAANYVQASMHNAAVPLTPAARVVKHSLFGTSVIEQLIKLDEGETLYRANAPTSTPDAELAAACAAANDYCQELRIGEWGGSTVRSLIDHHKRLTEQLAHAHRQEQRLDDEITELRALKFKSFAGDECWIWEGGDSDNLTTISCPVVIHPAVLREIIRQRNEAMQLASEAQPAKQAVGSAAACTPVPETSKLPMQPIVWVGKVLRFKENRIVRHLLDHSTKTGCGLNELARMEFTEEERMQLAQLIGYSVSGYGELSYASQESVETADAVAEWLAARKPETAQ